MTINVHRLGGCARQMTLIYLASQSTARSNILSIFISLASSPEVYIFMTKFLLEKHLQYDSFAFKQLHRVIYITHDPCLINMKRKTRDTHSKCLQAFWIFQQLFESVCPRVHSFAVAAFVTGLRATVLQRTN